MKSICNLHQVHIRWKWEVNEIIPLRHAGDVQKVCKVRMIPWPKCSSRLRTGRGICEVPAGYPGLEANQENLPKVLEVVATAGNYV